MKQTKPSILELRSLSPVLGAPIGKAMWEFAASLGGRVPPLREVSPDGVIEAIQTAAAVLCGHAEVCTIRPGFSRVAYCVSVGTSVFDLFFNSEVGYRGSYFVSQEYGVHMNCQLLQALQPKLLNYCDVTGSVDRLKSLSCTSAKLWLAEVGKHRCLKCEGEWNAPSNAAPEILNGRWELDDHPYGRYGCTAPYLTKVRIFGGFVDEAGAEFIPPDKVRRAADLFERGWS